MKKAAFILTLFSYFLFHSKILAQDGFLFSKESDGVWFPGRFVTKEFSISNESSTSLEYCVLISFESGNSSLAKAFNFELSQTNGAVLKNNNLEAIVGKSFGIGLLPAKTDIYYNATLELPFEAAAEFQNKSINLSLATFPCKDYSKQSTTSSSQTSVSVGGKAADSSSGVNVSTENPPVLEKNTHSPTLLSQVQVVNSTLEKVLGENNFPAIAPDFPAHADFTDYALQNRPSLPVLLGEQFFLLGLAFVLVRRSGYLSGVLKK